MSQSKLTPYQDECLEILAEECSEVIKEKCKIFRFGCYESSFNDPEKTHVQCLENEIGDLLAIVEMVTLSGIGINPQRIEEAKQKKLIKVAKWMFNKKEHV